MKRWKRLEYKDAAATGGKRVAGSGNTWHSKGDGINATYLTDVKDALDCDSYAVKFDQFEYHCMNAIKVSKIGIIKVYWKDSVGITRKLVVANKFLLDGVEIGAVLPLPALDQASITINFNKFERHMLETAGKGIFEINWTNSRGQVKTMVVFDYELISEEE